MKKFFSIIKKTGITTIGIILLLVIWSFIEPHAVLNIEDETTKVKNLPPSWQGKKIAQLTDFQVGLWGDNRNMIDRTVNVILEEKPDLVLITGDFIYHAGEDYQPEIEAVIQRLTPLIENQIPVYAVLGNHDYAMDKKSDKPDTKQANYLQTQLESLGIKVLENESVELKQDNTNESLYLVGVGSQWAKRDDIAKALSSLPSNQTPHIVMMHNPDSFPKFPANTASFSMAGHTHGGQGRIPGFPQFSWLRFVQDDEVYADGWVADGYGKQGNKLYINPGIGMSIVPTRLFCPPELTFFTLLPQSN